MRTNPLLRIGIAVVAAATLAGTAWAERATDSTLRQVGATAVLYKGPDINVVVSNRFARYNPEGQWLLLDTVMNATSAPLEIPRGAIAVRTPFGEVVPLATQGEFEKGYSQLSSANARANVIREPLGYLIPLRYRPLGLFAPQGIGLAWDYAWLDSFHNSYGRLYFHLPNGVHKGRYQLLIHLHDSDVAIPFTV